MEFTVALAMAPASVFGVGHCVNLGGQDIAAVVAEPISLKDSLLAAIPSNPFKAFAADALLPTIVFAVFFGLAINLAGEAAQPVRSFFEGPAAAVFKLISMMRSPSPFGVFGLTAFVTADHLAGRSIST